MKKGGQRALTIEYTLIALMVAFAAFQVLLAVGAKAGSIWPAQYRPLTIEPSWVASVERRDAGHAQCDAVAMAAVSATLSSLRVSSIP